MFGFYLQQMRRNRGITSSQLAERAGLSRRSVSRWENCTALPRIPELLQLLDAIGADADERAHCLSLIPAPRAQRHRRLDLPTDAPGCWEALWGLRLRSGMPLTQAAEAIGVNAATISRWERGESWPNAQKLQLLCTALGASADEYAAIQSARFPTAEYMPNSGGPNAVERFTARLYSLQVSERESVGFTLYNLRALALTTEGMQLLPSHPELLPIVASLLRGHIRHLSLSGMYPAANRACRRLLDLTDGKQELFKENVTARAFIARGIVRGAEWLPGQLHSADPGPSSASLQTAIRIVSPLLHAPVDPDSLAWLHSLTGLMYGLAGRQTEAAALLNKGVEIAEHAGIETAELRRVDSAGLMLYCNKPEEALAVTERAQSPYACPMNNMYTAFLKAAAMASVGDNASSIRALEPLELMSNTYETRAIRDAAANLKMRLIT
jgi:transcriptional regulator with XRE-family HTH domain